MTKNDTLRDAIAAIANHIGALDQRYHEKEAIALIHILGKCGPILAAPVEATEEQEDLRREIHLKAFELECAIRRAIGYPAVEQYGQDVVARVDQLRVMVTWAHRKFV